MEWMTVNEFTVGMTHDLPNGGSLIISLVTDGDGYYEVDIDLPNPDDFPTVYDPDTARTIGSLIKQAADKAEDLSRGS